MSARTWPVLAAAAALLAAPLASPARAQAAVKIDCLIRVGTPTGSSSGSGDCTVTGAVGGRVLVSEFARIAFATTNACPVGTAVGTMTGALHVDFTWTRIGAAGVFVTTGEVVGFGPMTFSSPCPAGAESVTILLAGA